MKRRLLLLFALSGSLLCSCESEDLENWQVKKPNGQVASEKELSAGISTIFSNAPDAYDTQANWVTGELERDLIVVMDCTTMLAVLRMWMVED